MRIADGLKPIPHRPLIGPPDIALGRPDTSDKFLSSHCVLPHDKARFAGEAVAMVIAESISEAKNAAERVRVDFEPLPAVTDTVAAAGADAPQLWDEASSNVCIDAEVGDAAATAAAFAHAAHVVKLDTWIQRVTGVPLEPRAAIGSYDAASGRTTLYAGSGGVVRQKHELAGVLGVPPDRVRVVSGDVGGNFGTRNAFYPEFALVAWASRRIGRPVKWTCERQEAFLSDYQGRDLFVSAELALDGAGRFLALRGSLIGNVGAHTVSFVPLIKGVSVISGVYRIPAACLRARAVMSNTPPTNPYRSAGRPEAMFVIERLIDLAAAAHGFDRIELRRRNLIGADATPYTNPLGLTYEGGEYERVMDCALSLGHWDGFAQRRRAAARRGKRRGIAVANYIEFTTGAPREWTKVTVAPEGRVDVAIGTLSSGQGHQTSFAQLVTDWLGVPLDCVHLLQGDTDIVPVGGGSHSGRSMRLAGIVIGKASDTVIAKGKRIAAHVLEAAEHDIEFSGGAFTVQGTDRSIGIFEVGARSDACRNDLPADSGGAAWPPNAIIPSRSAAFPMAAMSAKSRSTSNWGRSRSSATPPSTTSAARSILAYCMASPMAGSHKGSGRPCSKAASTTGRAASCCRARSRITPSRGPTISSPSPPRSARCFRPTIRWASVPAAKAAPRPRSRWWSVRWSTPSRSSASRTWKCQSPPSRSGAR